MEGSFFSTVSEQQRAAVNAAPLYFLQRTALRSHELMNCANRLLLHLYPLFEGNAGNASTAKSISAHDLQNTARPPDSSVLSPIVSLCRSQSMTGSPPESNIVGALAL